MAFQVSPGVQIREFDLTAIVPAVSTTPAGYVGVFQWGPADQRVLINTEKQLETIFGKPINQAYHATSWLMASNFLAYGGNLQTVRYVHEIGDTEIDTNFARTDGNFDLNAVSVITAPGTGTLTFDGDSVVTIKNREHYESLTLNGTSFLNSFIAKYPGKIVNGLRIAVIFSHETSTSDSGYDALYDTTINSYIAERKGYLDIFGSPPRHTDHATELGYTNDEIHIAVIDTLGHFGTVGEVLEKFEGLSLAADAKKADGTSNYYKSVINNRSQYLWIGTLSDQIPLSQSTAGTANWNSSFSDGPGAKFKGVGTTNLITVFKLDGGSVGTKMDDIEYSNDEAGVSSAILNQYELSFEDADESDISILVGYNTTSQVDLTSLISIAEERKDSIAFVSACYNMSHIGGPRQDILDEIIGFSNNLSSSSYGALDTGYKYQYDRFHNVYRYVPLCADSAGCAVRTDTQKDPWWSPAGYDRGRILNTIKLVFNPTKDERDELYKKNVNPVITSQGFGVILFGDKTLQKKPSAFDRINVRRLFNVLEKSIATAAKFQLFEFNDSFTRSQFKQMVEPFLRDIQGRRGVTSYSVVCDESNNPASVVDSNRFVADIFIAPNRSINFIQLNFVATPTGVSFTEYGG